MEEGDGSTMNSHSENKSPPSQNPFLSMSDSMNDILENVDNQELINSETTDLNPSGNPFLDLDPYSLLSPAVLRDDGTSNSNAEPVSVPRSASDCSDDEFPIRSMTNPELALQNPPVQVMERGEDPDSPSVYRIPSHVFDRSKSNNAPEWSAASNESLFSINVGNMSFTRELNWMSGEINASVPQTPVPPAAAEEENGSQSPATKFKDITKCAEEFKEGDGVTEAKAAETMREVIMETTTENYDLASPVSAVTLLDRSGLSHLQDHARHSDASTKSFAFKVQPEDDKSSSCSIRSDQEKSNLLAPHSNLKQETESPKQSLRAAQSLNASHNHTYKLSTSNNNIASTPSPPPLSTYTSSSSSSKWLCCFACCK